MFVRKRFLTAGLKVMTAALLVPPLAGCGGGGRDSEAAVETGSQDGFLRTVKISPPPGSVFISKKAKFLVSWEDGNPPPPSFTAVLVRYDKDGVDSTVEQNTQVVRRGTENVWEVSRTDNFDLDQGGVYYLKLNSGLIEVLAAYIVRNDGRSSDEPSSQPKDAGSQGAYRHLILTR